MCYTHSWPQQLLSTHPYQSCTSNCYMKTNRPHIPMRSNLFQKKLRQRMWDICTGSYELSVFLKRSRGFPLTLWQFHPPPPKLDEAFIGILTTWPVWYSYKESTYKGAVIIYGWGGCRCKSENCEHSKFAPPPRGPRTPFLRFVWTVHHFCTRFCLGHF